MKKRIPTFDDYLNEMLDVKPIKTWIDVNLRTLDIETMNYIWKIYLDTYGSKGIDLSATDVHDMQNKYESIMLMDVDGDKLPDAFIFYKKTPYGNKIALGGATQLKEARQAFVKKLLELVTNKTGGWYAEGSLKVDEILKSNNVHYIDDEQLVKTILNKPIDWLGDGYYERKLSRADKNIIKRMYGYPKI